MQLLDSEALAYALEKQGIAVDLDAQRFYAELWALIKSVQNTQNEKTIFAAEKKLRALCKSYFNLAQKWIDQESKKHPSSSCCSEGRLLQKNIQSILKKYERQFHRYALCYMHLNRALIIGKKKIQNFSLDHEVIYSHQTLKLTDTTGVLLKRAYREKKNILQKRTRILKAQNLLLSLQEDFALLKSSLQHMKGLRQGSREYTAFRGYIRQGDIHKAEEKIESWSKKPSATQRAAEKIIRDVVFHQKDLKIHDGLMLAPSDTKFILSLIMADETRIDKFLNKYNIPFMEFQFHHLLKTAYKLGAVGSLEGLLVLHAKMVSAIATPLKSVAESKRCEEHVYNRASDLIENKFTALTGIFDETEILFDRLNRLFDETDIINQWAAGESSQIN